MNWAISTLVAVGAGIIGCAFWLFFRGEKKGPEPMPEDSPQPIIMDRDFVKELERIMRITDENNRLLALAELYNTWSDQ